MGNARAPTGRKKWTCTVRPSGRKYSVIAATETEAAGRLVIENRLDPRKLDSLVSEDYEPVEAKHTEVQPEMCFVVTVGNRDYTVPASDELEAIQVASRKGLNVAKLRSVRRKE